MSIRITIEIPDFEEHKNIPMDKTVMKKEHLKEAEKS